MSLVVWLKSFLDIEFLIFGSTYMVVVVIHQKNFDCNLDISQNNFNSQLL